MACNIVDIFTALVLLLSGAVFLLKSIKALRSNTLKTERASARLGVIQGGQFYV